MRATQGSGSDDRSPEARYPVCAVLDLARVWRPGGGGAGYDTLTDPKQRKDLESLRQCGL